MNHAFKSIFATLMLTLALNSSLGQKHLIELSLDPVTGLLSDPGITNVNRGDFVLWQIKAGENIEWFQIEGTRHPFNDQPNSSINETLLDRSIHVSMLGANIRRDAPFNDWKYNIIYQINKEEKSRVLDPKIAVNPSWSLIPYVIAAIIVFVIIIVVVVRKKK